MLLAEDEEAMGRLLKSVLAQHGYTVLVARDGQEAIDLYQRHQKKIDVVLLDMGLPKISGRDVILKMKADNPNVSVIVASGYVDPELKAEMYRVGVKGFVDKPYRPGHIVEMLGSLVDRQ